MIFIESVLYSGVSAIQKRKHGNDKGVNETFSWHTSQIRCVVCLDWCVSLKALYSSVMKCFLSMSGMCTHVSEYIQTHSDKILMIEKKNGILEGNGFGRKSWATSTYCTQRVGHPIPVPIALLECRSIGTLEISPWKTHHGANFSMVSTSLAKDGSWNRGEFAHM